jgi:hypothetical protein
MRFAMRHEKIGRITLMRWQIRRMRLFCKRGRG